MDLTPPSPPLNVAADIVLPDQVKLKWSPATDNVGVAFYTIYRDEVQIDAIFSSDTTYYDFSAAAGRSYVYSVGAVDDAGNWSALNSIEVLTPYPSSNSSQSSSIFSSSSLSKSSQAVSSSAISNSQSSSSKATSISSAASSSVADTTKPSSPTQITKLSALSTQVDISWTQAVDNIGVTSYKIYRDNTLIGTVGSNILTYSDKTAFPNSTYWYGVAAGDAAGNWSDQKLINIVTPASLVAGNVTLRWLPPVERENGTILSSNEIGGYSVRYRLITDTIYTYLSVDKSQTSTTLTGLFGDYIFEIAVYDANGLYSNFVTIKPQ